MNNKPNVLRNKTGSGIKLLSLLLAGAITLVAFSRVSNLWLVAPVKKLVPKKMANKAPVWYLPDEIFADCQPNKTRKAIVIDPLAPAQKPLSDAWNFCAMDRPMQHTLLNTGWGKRTKKSEAPQEPGISTEKFLQVIPQGNFAYSGPAFHQVNQLKYPESRNSMPNSGGNGKSDGNHANSSGANNGSYAGGNSKNSNGLASQPGNNDASPQNEQKAHSGDNQTRNKQEKSPLEQSTEKLIQIIENKMLSTETKGKNAFSQNETDQSFAQFQTLVTKEWETRGTQQKDRLAKLRAKLAITDVINAFTQTLAHAPQPNRAIPLLNTQLSTKITTKKATEWNNLVTNCQSALSLPVTATQTNPHDQMRYLHNKINQLLARLDLKPDAPNYDYVRELELAANIQEHIKNTKLPVTADQTEWGVWIEKLGTYLDATFGTPWFDETALKAIMRRIEEEIKKAVENENSAHENIADADLATLQKNIMASFDSYITNPLFRNTLGLDLASYRTVFASLTESGNANKLQEIGSLLQEAGLNQTGQEQLNLVTKEIMNTWVALASAFSGEIGGFFKKIMHSATTFLSSPDGKDLVNGVGSLVGAGVGAKALTNIFSSTTSSLITLAALGGLFLKWQEFSNAPDGDQKMKDFLGSIGDWGDTILGGLSSFIPGIRGNKQTK